jgi:uncharacterized damage-inducible protein DinB
MTTAQTNAMSIAQMLLPEFDSEMATTRRVLERVPDAETAWKPHPKSATLGELALHISNIPHWMTASLKRTELDLSPPGGPSYDPPAFRSMADALADFDRNVEQGREAIAAATDADFAIKWTLKFGGKVIFSSPRTDVVRSFVMSHLIHHRGQLTVYLRLKDIPLPSVYGPTADEQM